MNQNCDEIPTQVYILTRSHSSDCEMTLHQNRPGEWQQHSLQCYPSLCLSRRQETSWEQAELSIRMDLEKHFWVSCKLAASFIETANGLLEFAFFCDEINQWSPHFMIKDCYELIERLVDIL